MQSTVKRDGSQSSDTWMNNLTSTSRMSQVSTVRTSRTIEFTAASTLSRPMAMGKEILNIIVVFVSLKVTVLTLFPIFLSSKYMFTLVRLIPSSFPPGYGKWMLSSCAAFIEK